MDRGNNGVGDFASGMMMGAAMSGWGMGGWGMGFGFGVPIGMGIGGFGFRGGGFHNQVRWRFVRLLGCMGGF